VFKRQVFEKGACVSLLIAQAGMVSILALWMTVAVRDNILHPSVNGALVAEVLGMVRLKAEFPDLFAIHEKRAVHAPGLLALAMRAIVLAELCAALLLWGGVCLLVLALFGAVPVDTARALARFGALAFTAVWGGFLIGGNFWCYWMCHSEAQKTHMNLALLGLGTMILVSL
jgi:predicted small integral membrane protein